MYKTYYTTVLKQDFITKYFYNNFLEIPKINKVVLHFSVSQISLKALLPTLAALLLISNQKPFLLQSKKTTLRLRIKHGSPIGCKVDLRGKSSYLFLEKLCFLVLSKNKDFSGLDFKKKAFFIRVDNLFAFNDIEKEYVNFSELPVLNIYLVFNSKTTSETINFLKGLKFPYNQTTP